MGRLVDNAAAVDQSPREGRVRNGVLEQFDQDIQKPLEIQDDILRDILRLHQHTEHQTRWGLKPDTTLSELQELHPVTDYSHYQGSINAVAEGTKEASCLVGDRLASFLHSSGTSTGRSKLVPRCQTHSSVVQQGFALFQAVLDAENPRPPGGKTLIFNRMGRASKTVSGHPVGGPTTLGLKAPHMRPVIQRSMVSPYDLVVMEGLTQAQYLYAQLMCGLLRRQEVSSLGSNYASSVFKALLLLETHWRAFLEHIRTLQPPQDTSLWCENTSGILSPLLEEHPDRAGLADELQTVLDRGFQGVVERLFPGCRQITCVTTGSMALYVPLLRRYAGGVPLVSLGYLSSVGSIAVNTDPLSSGEPVYTFLPRQNVYEFLPVEEAQALSTDSAEGWRPAGVVGLGGVEVGRCYELLLTTYSGLYRYRLKDVVKIVGFDRATPKMTFQYRSEAVLNIHGERTSGRALYAALSHAVVHLQQADGASQAAEPHLQLLDYTSAVDSSAALPRYAIYCEFTGPRQDGCVTQEELKQMADAMEKQLGLEHDKYAAARADGSIGPLCVHALWPGTFFSYQQHKEDGEGTDPSLFKLPRCVTTTAMKDILQAGVKTSATAGAP